MEDTKMDDLIKNLCRSIIEEAQAVITNTDRVSETFNNADNTEASAEAFRAFSVNRLDSIEHIQNLTIALTRVATGEHNNADKEEGEKNG